MKKLIICFLASLIFIPHLTKATHYIGGEITWECMTGANYTAAQQGRYRFHMKLYRECYSTYAGSSAAAFGTSETLYTTVPGLTSFTMSKKTGWPKDISPSCYNPALSIKCVGGSAPYNVANSGAMQEYYYTSDVSYPNGVKLTGVPPATGWMFYHSSCCRNPSTNITGAGSFGWKLRAIMYPYNSQNTFPCFDNSPQFAEIPKTIICSGYPIKYNHGTYDNDFDELIYEWGQPLTETGAIITNYSPGYSYYNPFPSSVHNPNNIAAQLDTLSGEISLTSFTNGAFVNSVKVSSYKSGIKVSEVWRDFQSIISSCATNIPPSVSSVEYLNNAIVDTINPDDSININLAASDFQFNVTAVPQQVSISASGAQFGSYIPASPPNQATLSNISGCLIPPCATLTPAPGLGYPVSASFTVSTKFSWKPSINHVGQNFSDKWYYFTVSFSDDFCPTPAVSSKLIKILVKAPPSFALNKISFDSVKTQNISGSNVLYWTKPIDTGLVFAEYQIFAREDIDSNFQLIQSISNYNTTSFIHPNATSFKPVQYFIRTKCIKYNYAIYSTNSDTLYSNYFSTNIKPIIDSTSIINAYGNLAIYWQKPADTNQIFSEYQIYGSNFNDTSFQSIQTINNYNTTNFIHSNAIGFTPMRYYLSIKFEKNNKTKFSINSDTIISSFYTINLIKAKLDSTEVINENGDIELYWSKPFDPNLLFYSYQLFGSINKNGPYQLIDSISNFQTTSFIKNNGAISKTFYYFMNVKCSKLNQFKTSFNSDTLFTKYYDLKTNEIQYISIFSYPFTTKMKVTNIGNTPIGNYKLRYSILGIIDYTDTISTTLLPNSTIEHTFPQLFLTTPPNFNLCAEVLFLKDKNFVNDSMCIQGITGLDNIIKNQIFVSEGIPNPTYGKTNIIIKTPINSKVEIILTNFTGQVLNSYVEKLNVGENKIEIDLSNFSNGIYSCDLIIDGKKYSRKLTLIK